MENFNEISSENVNTQENYNVSNTQQKERICDKNCINCYKQNPNQLLYCAAHCGIQSIENQKVIIENQKLILSKLDNIQELFKEKENLKSKELINPLDN